MFITPRTLAMWREPPPRGQGRPGSSHSFRAVTKVLRLGSTMGNAATWLLGLYRTTAADPRLRTNTRENEIGVCISFVAGVHVTANTG